MKATEVPALRGLMPVTIFVPVDSMRAVCLRPSEPVMPWTMTRSASVRKMLMVSGPLLDGGVLGGGALLAASSSGVRLFSVRPGGGVQPFSTRILGDRKRHV